MIFKRGVNRTQKDKNLRVPSAQSPLLCKTNENHGLGLNVDTEQKPSPCSISCYGSLVIIFVGLIGSVVLTVTHDIIFGCVGMGCSLILFYGMISYLGKTWEQDWRAYWGSQSQVVETALGPVEFTKLGSAPYLLYIPGFGAGATLGANAWTRHYQKAGCGVISVSRPGYGFTPLTAAPKFEQQADVMAALLDTIGVQRVVVNGFSGGGPCALYFAAHYPQKTLGLILDYCILKRVAIPSDHWSHDLSSTTARLVLGLMTSPTLGRLQAIRHRNPRVVAQGLCETSNWTTEEISKEVDRMINDTESGVMDVARDYMDTTTAWCIHKEGMKNDLTQIALLPDITLLGLVNELKCPVLLQHGARDHPVDGAPCEVTQEAAKLLGLTSLRCQFHLYENGPHILQSSNEAKLFGRRAVAFFKQCTTQSEE